MRYNGSGAPLGPQVKVRPCTCATGGVDATAACVQTLLAATKSPAASSDEPGQPGQGTGPSSSAVKDRLGFLVMPAGCMTVYEF